MDSKFLSWAIETGFLCIYISLLFYIYTLCFCLINCARVTAGDGDHYLRDAQNAVRWVALSEKQVEALQKSCLFV